MLRSILTASFIFVFGSLSWAQQGDRKGHVMEPPPEEWNIPAPPLSPSEALEAYELGEAGFEVQLVAAEPLVINPVCLAFDGNGRPWVCEMTSYMPDVDATGENEPVGRISILMDEDGDGQADSSKVFLDGILLPRAVQFVDGGILWADQHQLYFTERLEGDKPGETTVIDEKWAPSGNVEHKANGLLYGLDNWIYNAKSDARYRLIDGEWVKEKTEFRGQWGIAQDDYGRLVTNTNSNLISMERIPPHYTVRNPHHRFQTNTVSKMRNEVHPIRITCGVNRGYMQGTLDERGYLAKATAACGMTIYRGDNFPEEFYGNAFIPEPSGLLVKRAILDQDGLDLDVDAAYPDKEFLASMDERNRIVNTYTAPDGTLMLVDMYHGILQHKTYVTSYLRGQILRRGLDKHNNDRGRLYRVVWKGKEPGSLPAMEGESSTQLVAYLDHPNGWWRDTAQRLIVQRQDQSAVPALRTALSKADDLGKIHAIWCLEGLGALDPKDVAQLSSAKNDWVTANAVRAAESLAGTDAEASTVEILAEVAKNSKGPQTDLHLVAALGLFRGDVAPAAQSAMIDVLARNDSDFFRDMAMSSLGGAETQFAKRAVAEDLPILADLAGAILSRGEKAEVETLLGLVLAADVNPKVQSKVIKTMASVAISKRRGAIAETLLSTAQVHPELRGAILDGMANGGKVKGYKQIALETRPTIFEEAALKEDKKLASVAKLFDLSGHKAIDYLASKEAKAQYELGRVEYAKLCIACHQAEGQGMTNMAPPLVDSEWVVGPEKRLIALTLDGVMGPITVNGTRYEAPEIQPVMPGLRMNTELDDEKLAAILTFVRNSWGNSAPPIEAKTVAKYRNSTEMRAPYTESELKKIK